ncbi:hypothetical protein H0H87_012143 [Tephrocybe sp. NHM501043]|nr:hypothetical protein H0H87_012143 [Tephrocybe sp. NHM501043]
MLCPGYTQVPSFGPPSAYEDDEEVTYVTLDLGSIEPTLVPSSASYRLIGLDTATPFLQLSGTILKGRHETLLGSELLFSTDGKPLSPPTTSTRICFHEVRLTPHRPSPPPSAASSAFDTSLPPSTEPTPGPSIAIDPALLPSTSTPLPIVPPSPRSSRRTAKPKSDPSDSNWAASAEAASLLLERVTGKNAPRTRAPRKSTATPPVADVDTDSEMDMDADAEKPAQRPKRSTRKGKAKATAEDLDELIPMPMPVDVGDGSLDEYEP